jgi:hypothetical protein
MTHTKDEAIKLALEEIKELVNQYVQIPKHHSSAKTLTILEQALAAPVQPLPFGIGGGLIAIKTLLSRDPCVHANTAIEMLDAILAAPPAAQRQWAGLTDEEIDKTPCELYAPDQGGMTVEEGLQVYARAIEAKLKEKNTLLNANTAGSPLRASLCTNAPVVVLL